MNENKQPGARVYYNPDSPHPPPSKKAHFGPGGRDKGAAERQREEQSMREHRDYPVETRKVDPS